VWEGGKSYAEKCLLYRGNDLAIQELKVPSFVYDGINSFICAVPVRTVSHGTVQQKVDCVLWLAKLKSITLFTISFSYCMEVQLQATTTLRSGTDISEKRKCCKSQITRTSKDNHQR
jgi:hypothetical protein